MAPGEVAAAVRARLAAEIERELVGIVTIAGDVADFARPAHDSRDERLRASGLAFEIERFYTAVESVLERIVRALDGDAPTGPSSHADLLRAAEVAVPGLRAAIVSPAAAAPLRELLRFRHYARHGYAERPELSKLEGLARSVEVAMREVRSDLDAFRRSLLEP